MKKAINSLLISLVILVISACQGKTETAFPATEPTSTISPATQTSSPTPTLIPVSVKDLAGLIISSPILGTPLKHPSIPAPEDITPNGLGIINADGELTKISGVGLFESFSPSGIHIVYQEGFEDDFGDYVYNLKVYNAMTGKTVEIFDDIENEGGKTVVSWLQNEEKFIYYNDFYTVLFEAFGYFEPKQLFLADVKTGQNILLVDDGYQFDVSPDETQVAYTKGELIEIKIQFEGENIVERFGCFQPYIYTIASISSHFFDTSQLKEEPLCLGYPKWSPDGEHIAWMGYFDDNTFRPVVFNVQTGRGTIYDAIEEKPEFIAIPNSWHFGESNIGQYSDPDWIDNHFFWTPSYEVNIETGQISNPREIEEPYYPWRDDYIESPDKLIRVSLNDSRDAISISDMDEGRLGMFMIDNIYHGERFEILQNNFYMLGATRIMGWSPFAPP